MSTTTTNVDLSVLPAQAYELLKGFEQLVSTAEAAKAYKKDLQDAWTGTKGAISSIEKIETIPEGVSEEDWNILKSTIFGAHAKMDEMLRSVVVDQTEAVAAFEGLANIVKAAPLMGFPTDVVEYVQSVLQRYTAARTTRLPGSRGNAKPRTGQNVQGECSTHGHLFTKDRADRNNILYRFTTHLRENHLVDVESNKAERSAFVDTVLQDGDASAEWPTPDGSVISLKLGTGPVPATPAESVKVSESTEAE